MISRRIPAKLLCLSTSTRVVSYSTQSKCSSVANCFELNAIKLLPNAHPALRFSSSPHTDFTFGFPDVAQHAACRSRICLHESLSWGTRRLTTHSEAVSAVPIVDRLESTQTLSSSAVSASATRSVSLSVSASSTSSSTSSSGAASSATPLSSQSPSQHSPAAVSPAATLSKSRSGRPSAAFGRIRILRLLKVLALSCLGAVVLASGTLVYLYETDADVALRLVRLRMFWGEMFPIWIHYRVTQLQQKFSSQSESEKDAAFDDLHRHYAPIILNLVHRLRGFYIKVGQIGSTRNDFVPRPYLDVLTTLQDGVPQLSAEWARKRFQEESGKSVEEVFDFFDDKALGAATIGQVHAATLKDGREVVVKLQYPEVEQLFKLDIATVRLFTQLAQPEHSVVFNEIEKQFMTEFDFVREAQNLKLIGEATMKQFPDAVVPMPVDGLVSRRMLVMSKVPGMKVIDALKVRLERMAEQQGRTVEDLKKEINEKREAQRRSGIKPQPPTHLQLAVYRLYLAVHDWIINSYIRIRNVFASQPLPMYGSLPLIDARDLIDRLNEIHAFQIFQLGSFNGDCHPGNVLLLPDGRIGLIDYGQVKSLSPSERYELAQLIVSLADDDYAAVVARYRRMGFVTEKGSDYVTMKSAIIMFDRDDLETTEGMNLQFFLEKLATLDRCITFPDQYLMAGRVGMLIRGLATWLDYPHSSAQAMKPAAMHFIQDYERQQHSA